MFVINWARSFNLMPRAFLKHHVFRVYKTFVLRQEINLILAFCFSRKNNNKIKSERQRAREKEREPGAARYRTKEELPQKERKRGGGEIPRLLEKQALRLRSSTTTLDKSRSPCFNQCRSTRAQLEYFYWIVDILQWLWHGFCAAMENTSGIAAVCCDNNADRWRFFTVWSIDVLSFACLLT